LKLPADPQKFTITYSPMRGGRQLTVNSRSMLQIMQAFASIWTCPKLISRTAARGFP